MKNLITIILIFTLFGCENIQYKKKYKFVKTIEQHHVGGRKFDTIQKIDTIEAIDDTTANLQANQLWIIENESYETTKELYKNTDLADDFDKPIFFRLFSPEGKDITNLNFNTKKREIDNIKKSVKKFHNETEKQVNTSKNNINKEEIAKQFSKWDGSHKKVEEYLKSSLNDPDSYEHVETIYDIVDGYLIIHTKIRANNGFGAKVLQQFDFKVDKDTGEILEQLK